MMFDQQTDEESSSKKYNIRPFKDFSFDQTVTVLECSPFYMTASDAEHTEEVIRNMLKMFNERVQELYLLLNPGHSVKKVMKLST